MNDFPPKWAIEEQIRVTAYYKWEQAGCPPDMSCKFWTEAEAEVRSSYEQTEGGVGSSNEQEG